MNCSSIVILYLLKCTDVVTQPFYEFLLDYILNVDTTLKIVQVQY
jgi:hypothetical protein